MPLEIKPVAYVSSGVIHPDDVTATLQGLDGAYSSTDLYARYRSVAIEQGHTPGTDARLGRIFARLGYHSWRTATTRGWHIRPS